MTTVFLAIGIFALCFFMLGVGFFIRGVVLKGSCGGAAAVLGEEACGACAKKDAEICPTDDDTGLLNISNMSNPHRTMREGDEPPPLSV